jgi:GT2 family glycosyltransferase
VIIPTYERRDAVARAVHALARQTAAPDRYEVVVSIDGSTDGTRERLEGCALPCRLTIRSGPHRGRAAARNAGIAAAAGELIILLDDDMEPAPGFVAAHIAGHAGRDRRGVLGAVPVRFDADSPPVTRYIGVKFDRHLARLAQPGHVFEPRDFYAGNFSVRREHLLAAGGFDEAFTAYGNEDVELFVRLARLGIEVVYDAAARADQHYEKGFAALARDNLAKGRTAVQLAAKHPEVLAHLKLATRSDAPLAWRGIRGVLVALGDAWPAVPEALIRLTERLERRRPAWLQSYYPAALAYFYWLGARAGAREPRGVTAGGENVA